MGIAFKLFVTAFVVFFLTDMLWLGWLGKGLYVEHYKPWLRLKDGQLQPLWWAALLVYTLFALAIVVFVTPLAAGSLGKAWLYGILLGAVVYGVYDFTTLAVFKNWPIGMAFIDWVWGMFLCGWTSFVTLWLGSYFH